MPDPIPTLPTTGAGGIGAINNAIVTGGNFLDLLMGKSQTTTTDPTSQTTTTNVDPAAIEQTIRQIMEGTAGSGGGGIAGIFGAERGIGGYNSTTARLLTNDLVSRIVGEIAKLTASKTTSSTGTSSTTSTPGKAKEAAALAALAKALQGANKPKSNANKDSKSGGGGGVKSPADAAKDQEDYAKKAEELTGDALEKDTADQMDRLADDAASASDQEMIDLGLNMDIQIDDSFQDADFSGLEDFTGLDDLFAGLYGDYDPMDPKDTDFTDDWTSDFTDDYGDTFDQ